MDWKMGDFDSSLNFVVGLQVYEEDEPDFDVLNNPYFEFVGYEMRSGANL